MASLASGENAAQVPLREGMAVYDRDDLWIGTIRRVQSADPNDPIDVREEQLDARDEDRPANHIGFVGWTVLEALQQALAPATSAPTELLDRLRREGFIEIGDGWLHGRHFAALRQIDRVVGDSVFLGITNEQLMRGGTGSRSLTLRAQRQAPALHGRYRRFAALHETARFGMVRAPVASTSQHAACPAAWGRNISISKRAQEERMSRQAWFEREDILGQWYPLHSVIAILGPAEGEATVTAMRQAGVDDENLHRWTGVEVLALMRNAEYRHPMKRTLRDLQRALTDEGGNLNVYERAARRGLSVVAVRAPDEATKQRAYRILLDHFAQQIKFYGTFAVTDLTPY